MSPYDVTEMDDVLDFVLHQNEPNPWSQLTTITVSSEIAGDANFSVADGLGRIVMTRDIKVIEGINEIVITKGDVISGGMYFYTLTMNEKHVTKPMVKVE